MSEDILNVKGLSVALTAEANGRRVVDGVDLNVSSNEIVCVVGESGSGKSVTAFSIMGSGAGRRLDPARRRGIDRRIGLAPARIARPADGDDLPGADDGAQSRDDRR